MAQGPATARGLINAGKSFSAGLRIRCQTAGRGRRTDGYYPGKTASRSEWKGLVEQKKSPVIL
ncbi:hypothetical protein AXF15_07215 [Desulfomicrobium orale DSM 12838]|uniref:Uncharacterized protein n=1 Tax=Desulfomicrobium orale DSM 12838 TaxID=888061 RepID=A0A109W5Z6_9BACT|nr:hypothetical protein AXF15_07215 [Desulfomicrobium orale DSM 12838]